MKVLAFPIVWTMWFMTDGQLQKWEADRIDSIVVMGSSADGRENQGLTPIDQYSCELFIN